MHSAPFIIPHSDHDDDDNDDDDDEDKHQNYNIVMLMMMIISLVDSLIFIILHRHLGKICI